jgi:hypothetical protein
LDQLALTDDSLEFFSTFFAEKLLEAIIHETSRYAALYLSAYQPDNTLEW